MSQDWFYDFQVRFCWGRIIKMFKDKNKKPEFCILQIKPMVVGVSKELTHELDLIKDNVICHSSLTLGNGQFNDIIDIIFVDPAKFKSAQSKVIAREIETLTAQLGTKTPYILVGPGRWGTADPWLGIPVKWQQISGAKIIVEVGLPEFPVDPSFGSHFFQNITSLHVAYFTIDPKQKNDILELDWIEKDALIEKGKYVDWYSFGNPLITILEGVSGIGMIQKPDPIEPEGMNEEESTGI